MWTASEREDLPFDLPQEFQSGQEERTTAGQVFGTTKIPLRVEGDIH